MRKRVLNGLLFALFIILPGCFVEDAPVTPDFTCSESNPGCIFKTEAPLSGLINGRKWKMKSGELWMDTDDRDNWILLFYGEGEFSSLGRCRGKAGSTFVKLVLKKKEGRQEIGQVNEGAFYYYDFGDNIKVKVRTGYSSLRLENPLKASGYIEIRANQKNDVKGNFEVDICRDGSAIGVGK